jgi:hypothetical protein
MGVLFRRLLRGDLYLSSASFGRGYFLSLGLKCLVGSCLVLLRGLLLVFVLPGPISVSFYVSA